LYDFVVVANRLPVDAITADDGTVNWRRSPGGLVAALSPALQGKPAAWVGWSGRAGDESGDSAGDHPLPADNADLALVEVGLTREQVELYYEGMSNATIWPLYHDAVATPTYHRHLWTAYREVNRRFADEVAAVAAPGATVWVHDYQLQLVPRLLRELRPDLRIGFFLHIPFPPIELFMQLPWRSEITWGLLGADLVGFQIPDDAVNFIALAARLCDALVDDGDLVVTESAPEEPSTRRVRAEDFPISIDFAAIDTIARSAQVQARAKEIRAELGNPVTLVLGVDRLDYTKGIGVRLTAIDELLEDGSLDPASVVFFQIATPSRGNVEEYQRIRDEIELAVGRAVGRYGSVGANPVQYLYQSLESEELIAFYEAADIMLVTPLRDGMNLVCKEYVAARVDGDGALVLSEFTGAALELTQAWLVNPYDADGVKGAILAAVHASPEDRARRMAAMRDHLRTHDVQRWAESFLTALARPLE
jgi:trehalose 6-phosphate synthase